MNTPNDNETAEAVNPLADALQVVCSYTDHLEEINPNLRFTQSGRQRLVCILGYIMGVAEAGQRELAEKMAADLNDNLQGLVRATPFADCPDICGTRYQPQLCLVSDDGTRHGFSVAWYNIITDIAAVPSERVRYFSAYNHDEGVDADSRDRHSRAPYRFTYNGGLLYHGPGDNSLSVTLGDVRFWGIHT